VQSSKSSWIIAGGYAGQTHADLEALKYMQHIQVECENVLSSHLKVGGGLWNFPVGIGLPIQVRLDKF
jgi:hypothetical protein